MSNGLGFNQYSARYMSKITDAGGFTITLIFQQAFENLASSMFKLFGYVKPNCVYPFYGGNEECHSIDLFGDSVITWIGSVTHNNVGVTGDGSTGLGVIPVVPAAAMNPVNWSLGVYVRTASNSDTAYDIGVQTAGNTISIRSRSAGGNLVAHAGGLVAVSGATASSQGLSTVVRFAVASGLIFKNGVSLASSVTPASSLPNSSITVCAASGLSYSTRNIAFAFAGPVVSVANNAAMYTAIQGYQTILGRQV